MLFWGLSWSNAKILGNYYPPLTIMFWRFLFASIVLIPIVFYQKVNWDKIKVNILELLCASILLTFYNFCYFKGTQVGLAGIGGVLVTTTVPILTTFLSLFIYKNKLFYNVKIGVLLGLISGVILLKLWNYSFENLLLSGNIYFILGAIIWSGLTILTQKITKEIHSLHFSIFIFSFSTILILIISPNSFNLEMFNTDMRFWLNFLSVTIGAMAFGTVAFFYATQKLGAHKASSFTFLVPVSAISFSIILLNEIPDNLSLLGCAIAILAVIIINLPQNLFSQE